MRHGPATPRPPHPWFTALVAALGLALLVAACGGSSGDGVTATTGAGIYREVCATCHGRQGGGFVGPSLVDVADRYSLEDEVELVTNGVAQMPAFGTRLTDEQIAKVVDYTRTEFSSAPTTTTTLVGPTLPTSSP